MGGSDWADQPKSVKLLFYETVPLPVPIIGIIFIAILLAPRYVWATFFPGESELLFAIATLVGMVVFILLLVGTMMQNYKMKTGRNLNHDVIELQNRQ